MNDSNNRVMPAFCLMLQFILLVSWGTAIIEITRNKPSLSTNSALLALQKLSPS